MNTGGKRIITVAENTDAQITCSQKNNIVGDIIFLSYFLSDCPGIIINILIYNSLVWINTNLISLVYKTFATI